jgi:hypothetical protein
MKRVYGNAEVGYYSGTENGLTVAGTDGYLHHWSGGGTYTKERILTAAEQDALYLRIVSKASLYEYIIDLYSGFTGRLCIDEFRAAVAEMRLHDGELTAPQWERLERMDAEIERNHAQFQLERAKNWLRENTLSSYYRRHADLVSIRGLANALLFLYGRSERRSLYDTGGIDAVYEYDRAEMLALYKGYADALEATA